MRRVEMDNFVAPAPANYVQPTLKQGPIVNPDRGSHGSPNDGRRSNVTNGSHAQRPSVNGFPDTQEPLPQRMSERRSQEPSHEYPPQPSRESQSARGGDRHTREPSSTANVYASQQPVATPPKSDAVGSQHQEVSTT
ncbi:hypothetical protein BDN70DRAFT_696077 [Pholiota conissans]|uniref:Uncharacterized protein n=1 Tax=Pholiota conissans TaxID=109636 RepID=A0A9P5Z0Y5_9AGAR|nr:hypothetical protein BDN70DRAFT_696077 [Pholiota conissans]